MAIVDQKTLFEIRLPCIGVCGIEQCTRVRDVGERVVAFFLGNGVGKMSGGVDITVENINDTVACFLAAKVCGQYGCDVRVVGESVIRGQTE